MPNPWIVVVAVDFAPWDSDIDEAIRVLGFETESQAWKFHNKVVSAAHAAEDIIIQSYEPQPAVFMGSVESAFDAFVAWIGENDKEVE